MGFFIRGFFGIVCFVLVCFGLGLWLVKYYIGKNLLWYIRCKTVSSHTMSYHIELIELSLFCLCLLFCLVMMRKLSLPS